MEKFDSFNELILALLLWITSNTDYINLKTVARGKIYRTRMNCRNLRAKETVKF